MEFFFCLSGFVLAHTYGFKSISFKKFILNRTFRLYPLHIFVFIVLFFTEVIKIIAFHLGFYSSLDPFSGAYSLKEIIPNLLFLQSWLPGFDSMSWNGAAWSLSVEYYMYIIFFFTLFIKSNFKYLVWFLFSFISFFMIINNFEIMNEVTRGISCFFTGALIYLIYKNTYYKFEKINKLIFSFIEISLIILIIYIVSYIKSYKAIYASCIFLLIVFIFAFEKVFYQEY